jgi:hypothetical protein
MHQHFESYAVETADMGLVIDASDKRISLILQNQHATANIWIGNQPHLYGAARLLLPPGGNVLHDYRVPSDAIYAQTDTAGAELTVITGS